MFHFLILNGIQNQSGRVESCEIVNVHLARYGKFGACFYGELFISNQLKLKLSHYTPWRRLGEE
jgi:hypothetical protein